MVHPGWLLGVRQALSQEGVYGMTGLVLAEKLETESQIRFEFDFGGFNGGYRPIIFDSFFFKSTLAKGVPVWRIGAGANMAFRREVFSRIGVFDERLGAGAAGCSEDSEFWYRILAAGMMVKYEPRAVVWHTHRAGREAFQSQMHQIDARLVAALLVQFEKHRHAGNIRQVFLTLPYHYRQRLKRLSHQGDWTLLRAEMGGMLRDFGLTPGGSFRGPRRSCFKTRCLRHLLPLSAIEYSGRSLELRTRTGQGFSRLIRGLKWRSYPNAGTTGEGDKRNLAHPSPAEKSANA